MSELSTEHVTEKVTKFDPETGETSEITTETRTDILPEPAQPPEPVIIEEIPAWMTERISLLELEVATQKSLLEVAQATVAMLETERDGLAERVVALEKTEALPSPAPEPEPDPPSPSPPEQEEEPEIIPEKPPASGPAKEADHPEPEPENELEQRRKRHRLII